MDAEEEIHCMKNKLAVGTFRYRPDVWRRSSLFFLKIYYYFFYFPHTFNNIFTLLKCVALVDMNAEKHITWRRNLWHRLPVCTSSMDFRHGCYGSTHVGHLVGSWVPLEWEGKGTVQQKIKSCQRTWSKRTCWVVNGLLCSRYDIWHIWEIHQGTKPKILLTTL